MKFLHTADLHLGKIVNGFSMLEDQEYILNEIIKIASEQQAEGILIAGDVYDKTSPSAGAVALFDDFLFKLSENNINIFIISGNHDSAKRLSFGSRILQKSNVYISSEYEGSASVIRLEDEFGPLNVYLLPFIKPAQVREYFPDENIEDYTDALQCAVAAMNVNCAERNILIAHQFVTGAVTFMSEELAAGGLDNVSAQVFDVFDYVALGHIHGPQKIKRDTLRYSGTPLKYSFSECSHQKSVTIIDFKEKGNISISTRELIPKRDMKEIKGKYEELTKRSFYENTDLKESYLHVTLTDEEDVPEGLGRLRSVYPYLMQLDYDNKRTRAAANISEGPKEELLSPVQIFARLYALQNNKEMTPAQSKIIEDLAKEIWEEKA